MLWDIMSFIFVTSIYFCQQKQIRFFLFKGNSELKTESGFSNDLTFYPKVIAQTFQAIPQRETFKFYQKM